MKKIISLLLGTLLATTFAHAQPKITVRVQPLAPYIERGEGGQLLNHDFVVQNISTDTLTLVKLALSVYDEKGRLVHARFLDNNGTAPSIETLPARRLAAGSSTLVFNPFTRFSATLPLVRLEYEWTFQDAKEAEYRVTTTVKPRPYRQREPYVFPLKGRVLVYDGHDFYAHHRRFDYTFAPIKELGITANFMRYAYDLEVLDPAGRATKGEGQGDSSYYGWGQAVYAVAPGRVIYASNRHHDDKTFSIPGIAQDPLELYGNCIAVQQADSTVSVYGHLMQNSLKVKEGDRVKGGQAIAAIGVSGSSFFPHLHFEVRTSIKSSAEGLPSYFSNLYLWEGGLKKLPSGLAETGNVVETK